MLWQWSGWKGHSVHFGNFPMLTFQKATAPTGYIQLQPNLRKYGSPGGGGYKLLVFLTICQILKIYATLTISHLSYITQKAIKMV